METGELLRRLGYKETDKLVILNCDDLGSTYSANIGVYDALRKGIATSATLMVPCPWARHAALMYRGEDIGVHLTLNSEHPGYRWGPITYGPSLIDGDGGFPRGLVDLWEHADIEEVKVELRTQIERAILWGFEVTHLDSHMGALQLKPEFFDVYLELAQEFNLPMRLSARSTQGFVGFPFRDLADEACVIAPDYLAVIMNEKGVGSRSTAIAMLEQLPVGITEIYFHPAIDTPELRGATQDWQERVDDYFLLVNEDELKVLIEKQGAHLIGYRELKMVMQEVNAG
jgi:predicted glycoside hydrolase/deacetylase ChbG (UPF0249 family)